MRPTSFPLAFASLLSLLPTVYSSPVVAARAPQETPSPNEDATDKPFFLRTMPLGASITFGLKSTDGNGYRGWLRQQMRYAGWDVNMVGSVQAGEMEDNDNEGHSGYVVDQVAQEAEKTIPQAPNLILINAGTNDAVQDLSIESINERMNALIDRLYNTIPETTIILSTLIPNALDGVQDRVDRINTQYRDIVSARRENNHRIVLAEMSEYIQLSDLVDDKVHPNDNGYAKMAAVWWDAIQQAETEGLLQPPRDVASGDLCEEGEEENGMIRDYENDKGRAERDVLSRSDSESTPSDTCFPDDEAAGDDGDVSVDPGLPVYTRVSVSERGM